MGSRIDVVHEPRVRAHRGADAESLVLAADERLEVIVHDRLRNAGMALETPEVEEDGVAAEAFGHSRDRGLGAVGGACDLAVSRARRETGGHGDKEIPALQVIVGGESLPAARPAAIKTNEPGNPAAIAQRAIEAVPVETLASC